ncbi:IclR family transcriptional regulator [Xanthobacter wiegelii]|uniref:IclR family transcriptional regulator n=1 Tax=Xanthobacter wiegelii TaxID=3119913 RepID=UPI003728DF9B
MDSRQSPFSGAQSLGRAMLLLRLIARSGAAGASMAELAASADLPRPTAHRMLKMLVAEGMLEQEPQTRRYRMGPLAFELGLLAPSPTPLISACRGTLKTIAAETEDTIYLTMRSGIDGVCIDRIEASHAIRALTIDIGGRRPLGVGATGIALLAALPPGEAEAALMRNAADFKRYGRLTEQNVRENLEEARQTGFGYSVERITPGVSGIGIAIPNPNGTPYVGISVASITARIVGERQAVLEALLEREAASLAIHLAQTFPSRTT